MSINTLVWASLMIVFGTPVLLLGFKRLLICSSTNELLLMSSGTYILLLFSSDTLVLLLLGRCIDRYNCLVDT